MSPKTQKNLLYILIPSTILVVVWIAVAIHTAIFSSTISKEVSRSIVKIDPEFEMSVIPELKKRVQINGKTASDPQTPVASGEADTLIQPTAEPTPPSASESGEQL